MNDSIEVNTTYQEEVAKLIDICHVNLTSSKECMNYLREKRRINEKYINKYKLGYFPQSIKKLTDYVSEEVLNKLTIVDYDNHSKFTDYYYLIFPIYSEYNEAIGIGGRTLLDDNQRALAGLDKYKNSRFKKSDYLYGLKYSYPSILRENNVYVVEGYFDQIAMDANGITNSVAICGSSFSRNQFLKLARYTDKITFILDTDEAGMKSMDRIRAKFSNKGIGLDFKLLPDGFKDADEYFASGKTPDSFIKELRKFLPSW
jgi:DNA primase